MTEDPVRVAFGSVENAGRSQMAAAFARRAVEQRGLTDAISIASGGTEPADAVHGVVVDAMAEVGIDISDREPRELGHEAIMAMDYVITMGCSADDGCPATWRGDTRDRDHDDPAGLSLPAAREIREEIESRVGGLLDEIAGSDGQEPAGSREPAAGHEPGVATDSPVPEDH